MECPCKDCVDRQPDCHPKCKKYLEWRKYWDELKRKEAAIKAASEPIFNYKRRNRYRR